MKTRFRLLLPALLALPVISAFASGEINFCVDIPTTAAATTYQPYQSVNGYAPASIYSYAATVNGPGSGLSAGIHIDALTQRTSDGIFVFSVDAPATIGAATYHPADLISYNGSTYAKYLDHATDLGLGEDADITGISIAPDGSHFLTLDAPATLNQNGGGTITYDPRSIVRYYPGSSPAAYSLAFAGAAAGLPAGSRLIGMEYLDAANFIVSVDVPATLNGVDYGPGDAIKANGFTNATALYYRDTAFYPAPPPNAMTDFALPLPAGEVGNSLTLGKNAGNVTFAWAVPAGCAAPATVRDYAVYEGTLGNWYSHKTVLACSTSGLTGATLTPTAGNTYYLVVPSNGAFEGNYGADSFSSPIPVSAAACRPDQRGVRCS